MRIHQFVWQKRNAPHQKRNGDRKRRVALVLTAALLLGLFLPVMALATERRGDSTAKEEVVYINLESDGAVSGIYVVNIFDLDEEGRIIDYGDYTALRNLTTRDEIQVEDQKIRIDTRAGRLYYEGELNRNAIPWKFQIHYYMDGEEYTAEEIAGMSGSFRLTLDILENQEVNNAFFEHYALQVTLLLDTNTCSHITAENATMANVGRDLQMSYIVLPNKEEHIEVTAQAKDFKMAGISINGVTMDMALDAEDMDTGDLDEKVEELQDGAGELDDGALELLDGARELSDGAAKLKDGASALVDGSSDVAEGVDAFSDGLMELSDGAGELGDGVWDLEKGADSLIDGTKELDSGIRILLDGTVELVDGAKELKSGAKELRDGAKSLRTGANRLYDGLHTLENKNGTLITMSNTLYEKTLGGEAAPGIPMKAYLASQGFPVSMDTTSGQLSAMLEERQGQLTSEEEKERAMEAAVRERLADLEEATAQDPEDVASQTALLYWKLSLILQKMQEYEAALKEAGSREEIAEIQVVYGEVLAQYQTICGEFGGEEALAAAFGELSSQAAAMEAQTIEAMVAASLTGAVSEDPVYQALAVLSYYKGVIDYTQGVAEAASGAASLASGAYELYDGAGRLYDGAGSLREGTEELQNRILTLQDGAIQLMDGAYELGDGTLTLMDGVLTLQDGIVELSDGVLTLRDGVAILCDGAVELSDGTLALSDGTIELLDGTIELKDGTGELKDRTAHMRDELLDGITEAIHKLFGGNFTPPSFVSEQNTQVERVQFVIKTPDIAVEEAVFTEAEPEELSLWQKFLQLFGINKDDEEV